LDISTSPSAPPRHLSNRNERRLRIGIDLTCSGPHDPHAFDGIPVRHRTGDLDRVCPVCSGHGQWNTEYDLISQRSKRHICAKCDGRGWIETGDDMVPSHDIEMSPDGYPRWVLKHGPSDDRE